MPARTGPTGATRWCSSEANTACPAVPENGSANRPSWCCWCCCPAPVRCPSYQLESPRASELRMPRGSRHSHRQRWRCSSGNKTSHPCPAPPLLPTPTQVVRKRQHGRGGAHGRLLRHHERGLRPSGVGSVLRLRSWHISHLRCVSVGGMGDVSACAGWRGWWCAALQTRMHCGAPQLTLSAVWLPLQERRR